MKGKLKVDFHTHTSDDPKDYINFSSEQLIDRAATEGFDAIAITNHDALTFSRKLEDCAAERGILLIPGIEITISNKHVLLINPDLKTDLGIRSLGQLAGIKNDRNLIIAPHPFYPGFKCLKSKLKEYISSFDAVEFSFFYNHLINPNDRAVKIAEAHGKPLVGSSDCHNIWQVGSTYTLVEADRYIPSIIAAVKAGKVELVTAPLSLLTTMRVAANWILGDRLNIHWKI
jgi:predicted metal-dependent phosphoesterase TrpH